VFASIGGEWSLANPKELVAYVAAFTGPLAGNAILAMLNPLEAEWGISSVQVLLCIPAFMFPFAAMQFFSGTISDSYDRRKTLMVGLGVYIAASFASAASPSFAFFLATRVVQGIGYAFVSPVLVPILFDVAGKGREGVSMGYFMSMITAGVSFGPLMGGLLSEISWRLTFVAIGLVALAVLIAIWALFESDKGKKGALSLASVRDQLARAASNRNVLLLSVAGFASFMASIGILSFTSEHMGSAPMSFTPSEIGIALSISGAIGIFVAPVAGRMVDRRGPLLGLVIGYAIVIPTIVALPSAETYLMIVVVLFINSIGWSFISSPMLTSLMRAAPAMRGTASSLFNGSRFMGYALSAPLLTPIFLAAGYAPLIYFCGAVSVISFVLAFQPNRQARK
jgi:predicted MFS family arabinose efflux permease